MGASVNQVNLLGHVVRDPELKHIPSGTAVCELGLAMNERYNGQNGEWIENAIFVDVTLWGRTAEIACEYLRKGAQCFVSGRLALDQWKDKDTGKNRQKLKVVGEKLQLLGGKGGGGGRQAGDESSEYSEPARAGGDVASDEDMDDAPF